MRDSLDVSKVYLGAVYDAMCLLGYREEQFFINIKPKGGYQNIIYGPALTTYGRVVGKSENYDDLDRIRYQIYDPNLFKASPVVVLQANDSYCAHSGDITSLIYQSLGSVGFVSDGNVRDLDLIDRMQFPVFCKDSNPIDAIDYWAITKFNIPVVLEHVEVRPGDMIVASKDGVIRVMRQDLELFFKKISLVLEKECGARSFIRAVKDSPSFSNKILEFADKNGRW